MKLSMWRASLPGGESSTLKPFTSPAKWQAKALASNLVIVAMPDLPATMLAHPSATVLPTGQTRPSPVTTTRRRLMVALSLRVGLGVVDRQLHRRDLLGFLVGDLDAEFVFQRHHQFDRVERVRAQVGHEGLVVGHVGFGNAELFGNDFLDSCFDIAHDTPPGGLRKNGRILLAQNTRRPNRPCGRCGNPLNSCTCRR